MFKYVIFLLNFMFFLASLGLISLVAHSKETIGSISNSPFLDLSIILIMILIGTLIVSFCGCCGACTENKCMMLTYSTLLTLMTMTLIALSVASCVFKEDVKDMIKSQMEQGLNNYNTSDHGVVTGTWNLIQNNFDCCGVDTYKDWKNGSEFGQHGNVPMECCIVPTQGCGEGVGNENEAEAQKKIHTQGCLKKIEEFMQSNETAVLGIGAGVLVLLLIFIVISYSVSCRIDK